MPVQVTYTLIDAAGTPMRDVPVTFTLGGMVDGVFAEQQGRTASGQIVWPVSDKTDLTGTVTVSLFRQSEITAPANTVFRVQVPRQSDQFAIVSDAAGPLDLAQLLVSSPPALDQVAATSAANSAAAAAASATQASGSAAGASSSATSAAGSASAASGSATTAAGSASSASTSATGAAGSATSAANSASSASTSSTNAANSATAASTSATNAASSATSAASSAASVKPGVPGGTAQLDSNGLLVAAQLPAPFELRGTGSPYGTVTPASAGVYYTDTAATCGAIRWVSTGTTNTSWIVVVGDTGPRDVSSLVNTAAMGMTNVSGAYRLQRTGSFVTLAFGVKSWTTAGTIMTIPTGFTPDSWMGFAGVRLNASTVGQTGFEIQTSNFKTSMAGAVNQYIYQVWHTADSWPSTLPGTPA